MSADVLTRESGNTIKHRNRPTSLVVLITVVVVLGCAVLAGAAASWRDQDGILLVSLAALTVASEFVDFRPFRNSSVSFSIALVLAAGTFSGLPGIAIVAAAAAGTDYAVRHRRFDGTVVPPAVKGVFNLGALLITGAAYTGVLDAFGSTSDPGDWHALLVPVLTGSVVAFCVNLGLVALAISCETGIRLPSILNGVGRWTLPHFILLGVIGLLTAAAYDRWQILGLAAGLIPLGLVWLAMKQEANGALRSAAEAVAGASEGRDTQLRGR